MAAYAFNKDARYPVGPAFPDVELAELTRIQVNTQGAFVTKFPNVFEKYHLPAVSSDGVVQAWNRAPMDFWQNQVNFAVWCATAGCGVSSREHLADADPLSRAVFEFHVYYQIRRILKELRAAMPQDQGWGAYHNPYDRRAYERVCAEFGVSPETDWHVKGLNQGIGRVYIYWTRRGYRTLSDGGVYAPKRQSFTGTTTNEVMHIDYIAQDPELTHGWRAFVLDTSQGFTRPGVERINDSIRTYVWALLGAQAQTRTRILGTGTAFDAQKQYLALVEDAIDSPVDLSAAIKRYQDVLQNASSKVDYVYGTGLYMAPSDMLLRIGQTEGYNNMIVIAEPGLQRGLNAGINAPAPPPPPPTPLVVAPPRRGDPHHVFAIIPEPHVAEPAHHVVSPPPPPAQPHPTTTAVGKVEGEQHINEKTALIVAGVAVGLLALAFRG